MPATGAALLGANVNTSCHRFLFSASRDARLLGAPGSEVSSGQSSLHGANPSQASPRCGEVIDCAMISICQCKYKRKNFALSKGAYQDMTYYMGHPTTGLPVRIPSPRHSWPARVGAWFTAPAAQLPLCFAFVLHFVPIRHDLLRSATFNSYLSCSSRAYAHIAGASWRDCHTLPCCTTGGCRSCSYRERASRNLPDPDIL